VENKNNSPVNIRFVSKTSDIRNLSENIRSDVETSEVATLIAATVDLNVICEHKWIQFEMQNSPSRDFAFHDKI